MTNDIVMQLVDEANLLVASNYKSQEGDRTQKVVDGDCIADILRVRRKQINRSNHHEGRQTKTQEPSDRVREISLQLVYEPSAHDEQEEKTDHLREASLLSYIRQEPVNKKN